MVNAKRPKVVENPSFGEVIRLVKAYRDWLESDDYHEDEINDRIEEIAEEAIGAVMGPDFGTWVIEQQQRRDRV